MIIMQFVLAVSMIVLYFCTTVCHATPDPPPTSDLAKTARYIVHNADWCTLTTISSNATMLGHPFSVPSSISDGPVDKSSGVPYSYHAKISTVWKDVTNNPEVVLSFSETQLGLKECAVTNSTDPEWPLCARLSLMGNIKILTDPKEIAVAKTAMFSRHPAMASWDKEHAFVFMKLDITRILLLDFFGGWRSVSVNDYYNA